MLDIFYSFRIKTIANHYTSIHSINEHSQRLRTIVSLKSLLNAYNDMAKDNNQIEHKAIALAHKPLIVYVITALMVANHLNCQFYFVILK